MSFPGLTLIPRTRTTPLQVLMVSVTTVILSVLAMVLMFSLLGAEPTTIFQSFFIEPLSSGYNIGEVVIKASPLILIAQGLAIGFRAKVWNIGAEGQLIMGAITASLLPIWWPQSDSMLLLPAMIVFGALGGMVWSGIAALLRTSFNASEIIVTLMLTEIARQVLYFLLTGSLRDPGGYNFPQSVMFPDAGLYPIIGTGAVRANASIIITLLMTIGCWIFVNRAFAAFRLQVGGLAPAAAQYAGFSQKQAIWLSLLISGAAAGLAGMGEVAGPIGRLQSMLSPGYGYAAIIVAFLGGLNPIGIFFAGFLMAIVYVGGDIALVNAGIPSAAPVVFQGLVMVFYLGASLFLRYSLVSVFTLADVKEPV
ncbi:sugar ABC transporter permease [Devosia limi DSM 17137]|uniref:Simple sugar transport system permease protein n=1 Tax=Devosia limi DSM 17137 TaxID=1121477 RepID=A0A0F5LV02_9HYPH|nr:ABC transporter permease [Devosia limi]KKB86101.1 sugar ABC transporter permease [Devosia limi DSM 17137]SHF85216.1 simple sugar transport system permease protein [Devosia limi DSM 17137]